MTDMAGPERDGRTNRIPETQYDLLFVGIIDTASIRRYDSDGESTYFCYSDGFEGAVRGSAGAVASAIKRCVDTATVEEFRDLREDDITEIYDVLEDNGVVFDIDEAEDRSLVRYDDLYADLHAYLVTTNNRYRDAVKDLNGLENGENLYDPANQVVELISQARFSNPSDPEFVLEEVQLLHALKERLKEVS